MTALVWTPEADSDRQNIYHYIASENLRAAADLDEMISLKANYLVDFPNTGRPGRVKNTREFIVHRNYILVYEVVNNQVRILRVLHAARQWPQT